MLREKSALVVKIHKGLDIALTVIARPLHNAPFCPISASGSNFNPRNTKCIPVVKIIAFLELEQN